MKQGRGRELRALACAGAATVVGLLGATSAQAAIECSFDETSATAQISYDRGIKSPAISRQGRSIVVRKAPRALDACRDAGIDTRSTERMKIVDEVERFSLFRSFFFDFSNGIFTSDEAQEDGRSEIEITAALAKGGVSMTQRADRLRVTHSGNVARIDPNGDGDTDVTVRRNEEMHLALHGGDDRLVAKIAKAHNGAGEPPRVWVHGGSGRDRVSAAGTIAVITGGSESDRLVGGRSLQVFDGGPGGDLIIPGPGFDRVRAGRGNDRIKAADGHRDQIECNQDLDVVIADEIDKVDGTCEKVIVR